MFVEFMSMDLDYVMEILVDPWFAKIEKEGLFCKEQSVLVGLMKYRGIKKSISIPLIVEKP